jgi:hypothetical protein
VQSEVASALYLGPGAGERIGGRHSDGVQAGRESEFGELCDDVGGWCRRFVERG